MKGDGLISKTKKITTKELQEKLNTLSLGELLTILDGYATTNGENLQKIKEKLVVEDLQTRLIQNKINCSCPYCNSTKVIKFGKNGNVNRFKCKDCGKAFTLFTNTILEKTKYHWDIWVKMVQLTILNEPIETWVNALIKPVGNIDTYGDINNYDMNKEIKNLEKLYYIN